MMRSGGEQFFGELTMQPIPLQRGAGSAAGCVTRCVAASLW